MNEFHRHTNLHIAKHFANKSEKNDPSNPEDQTHQQYRVEFSKKEARQMNLPEWVIGEWFSDWIPKKGELKDIKVWYLHP